MPLINCKMELKLKWTKHCVLASTGTDNADDNSDDIVFTIKETKLCVPVITLSAKDNQKLLKLLSKGFERSVHWNEYIVLWYTSIWYTKVWQTGIAWNNPKKSASGSWTLPLVIFGKKVPFFPKIVLF